MTTPPSPNRTPPPPDGAPPTSRHEAWRSRPWVAALLNVLQPGLGQLYNGAPGRALLTAVGAFVWTAVMVALAFVADQAAARIALLVLAGGGVWAFCAWDAARLARRTPARRKRLYRVVPELRWQREFLLPGTDTARYEPSAGTWGPIVVPAGRYFLLGDHRDASFDSRYRSFIPREHLVGRPRWVYFSRDRQPGAVRWRRIGRAVR